MSEIYESTLPPKAYLAALRSCFEIPVFFYSERVAGITLGRFFSVAYYCPWEWNRRITSECNRAIGYVKEVDGKTQIHFIRSSGMMSPSWLLFWTLFCAVLFFIELGYLSAFLWAVCAVISFVFCLISAFVESLTEASAEGASVITSLLEKPDEFYYC